MNLLTLDGKYLSVVKLSAFGKCYVQTSHGD